MIGCPFMLGMYFALTRRFGFPTDVAVIIAMNVSLHLLEQKAPTPSLTAPDFSGCLSQDLGKCEPHPPHLIMS